MKKTWSVLATIVVMALGVFAQAAPTTTTPCADQAKAFVAKNLGQAFQLTQMNLVANSDNASILWARTNMCTGYLVFEFRASKAVCTMDHYGSVPNYITRVWGYGDCDKYF